MPSFRSPPAILLLAVLVSVQSVCAADKSVAPAQSGSHADSAALDPATAYKEVELKDLVARSRTEIPGQRVIFVPTAVKFRARLARLPAPQKTEYLMKALGMMRVQNPPRVSESIGLDYGGEKGLAAYIDEGAAQRLSKEAKVGSAHLFYAWHVYNSSHGPALVITSFEK